MANLMTPMLCVSACVCVHWPIWLSSAVLRLWFCFGAGSSLNVSAETVVQPCDRLHNTAICWNCRPTESGMIDEANRRWSTPTPSRQYSRAVSKWSMRTSFFAHENKKKNLIQEELCKDLTRRSELMQKHAKVILRLAGVMDQIWFHSRELFFFGLILLHSPSLSLSLSCVGVNWPELVWIGRVISSTSLWNAWKFQKTSKKNARRHYVQYFTCIFALLIIFICLSFCWSFNIRRHNVANNIDLTIFKSYA